MRYNIWLSQEDSDLLNELAHKMFPKKKQPRSLAIQTLIHLAMKEETWKQKQNEKMASNKK